MISFLDVSWQGCTNEGFICTNISTVLSLACWLLLLQHPKYSFACILIRFKFLRKMQQCLKSASLVGFPPTVPRANANPRGSMIMQYIFSQLNKTQAAQPQQAFRGSWGCGTLPGWDAVWHGIAEDNPMMISLLDVSWQGCTNEGFICTDVTTVLGLACWLLLLRHPI